MSFSALFLEKENFSNNDLPFCPLSVVLHNWEKSGSLVLLSVWNFSLPTFLYAHAFSEFGDRSWNILPQNYSILFQHKVLFSLQINTVDWDTRLNCYGA